MLDEMERVGSKGGEPRKEVRVVRSGEVEEDDDGDDSDGEQRGRGGGGGGGVPLPPRDGPRNDFATHTMAAGGCEGRIIGKGGESIRDLCQRTGAKIQIDNDTASVEIQGTQDQVGV